MLFRIKPRRERKLPPADIGGVPVRVSARARRMALRVEARSGEVVLTWPRRGASERAALDFIEKHRDWISSKRRALAPPPPLSDGRRISILGREYTVVHVQKLRGLVRLEEDKLVVHGDAAHLQRRIADFIRKEAARVLAPLAAEKAARLGLPPTPVRVRDPKARWGSCAPNGTLMFSWRLLLAPEFVLDYVVAHEVAHRVHMNHAPAFWELCFSLCTSGRAKEAKRWLRTHGGQLMSTF